MNFSGVAVADRIAELTSKLSSASPESWRASPTQKVPWHVRLAYSKDAFEPSTPIARSLLR
jgi:hypothetical protein